MQGFGAFNPAVKRCGFVRGKRTGLICEQSVALENERAVWTQLCRDMSHWPPPWSPRTLWSLRMALDYISGTATLYEVFLWNSLYCLTTSTWALRLRGRGVVASSRSEGVWYWWNMAGIFLSSTYLSFKGFEAADLLSLWGRTCQTERAVLRRWNTLSWGVLMNFVEWLLHMFHLPLRHLVRSRVAASRGNVEAV